MVLRVGVEVREERAEEAEDEGDRRQREQRVEIVATEAKPVEQPTLGRVYRLRFGRFAPPRLCWSCRFDSRRVTSWASDFGSGTGTARVPSTT